MEKKKDNGLSLPDLQAAEDPQYSVMAKVELKKMFGKRTVSILRS